MTFASDFWRSKVTWAGLAAILTAASWYLSGDLTAITALAAIFYALLQIFQRDATAKVGEKTKGLRG